MADLNHDGKLDNKEFSIACFLIKKVLTSAQGAAVLPKALPSSLLIDPTPPVAVATHQLPVATVSPVPLFQATFPSTLPAPPTTLSLTTKQQQQQQQPLPPQLPPTLPATLLATPTASSSPNFFPQLSSNMSMSLGQLFPTAPSSNYTTTTPTVNAYGTLGRSSAQTQATTATTTAPTFTADFSLFNTMSTQPTSIASPPSSSAMTSMTSGGLLPGAVPTPLVALSSSRTATTTTTTPLAPIPQALRARYTQAFQNNDTMSTGFISGLQAKTLLMQTGLAQAVLAQIW